MRLTKKYSNENRGCVEFALKAAKRFGADQAEVALSIDDGLSVSVRNGDIETLEYHQDKGLAVTVFINQCSGSANTSDLSEKAIKRTVKIATEIARFTAKDEYAGLANAEDLASTFFDLNLHSSWDIDADKAVDLALTCEDAAFKLDKRIINSEGVTVTSHETFQVYGNSHGFLASYPSSQHSLSCSVIASQGDGMQRDHWYSSARDAHFLEAPVKVGKQAAKRALARLNAQKISTAKIPILFSPDVSSGLFSHFLSAISGGSLYRKSTFLLDHLGKKVFPEWMHIIEQPHIIAGPGSRPYDSEGVKTRSRNIVEQGILQGYVLDSYSARKLDMRTTGNSGGIHNLIVEPGKHNFKAMLKLMDKGLLVTELMGQGINIVTGDYSRGAAGFWVENGKVQYPVEEITIAGNLKDMFQQIVAVGNDVDLRRNVRVGSVLIPEMMVSGN